MGNIMMDGHNIILFGGLGVLMRLSMLKLGSVEREVEDTSQFLHSFGT